MSTPSIFGTHDSFLDDCIKFTTSNNMFLLRLSADEPHNFHHLATLRSTSSKSRKIFGTLKLHKYLSFLKGDCFYRGYDRLFEMPSVNGE